jgi:hypothetical protein
MSFQKSGGHGCLQIKCQTALTGSTSAFTYRAWVGNDAGWQSSPEPLTHNFAENPVCDLPASSGLWNFNLAVDQSSSTFKVCIEESAPIDSSPEFFTPEKIDNRPQSIAQQGVLAAALKSPEKLPLARNLFNISEFINSPDYMLSKMLDKDWSSSSSDSDSDDDDA